MLKFVLSGLALLLVVGTTHAAMAEPGWPPVSVRDETGREIPAAKLRRIPLERGLLRIEASASGYYDSVHTFARDDEVADIVLVAKKPGRRLLLFAGDAMLSRRYFEPRENEPAVVRREQLRADGERLLAHVRPYVQLADIASVNLESVLAAEELTDPLPKLVTFYSPVVLAELLEWTGFDYAALGNNHTFDFRDAGVRATQAALGGTRLGFSGMGLDEASARAPWRTSAAGQPFAFLSYVGWPGTFSPTQTASGDKGGAAYGDEFVFVEDIAAVRDTSTVVLQQHSGLEYVEQAPLTERTSLRTAIDAGADLVIGHHAHVLQGLDIYKKRLIAYSMGNFLFDQYFYTTQLGMLLYVWMDGEELHRAEVVPININGYVPTPATGRFRYAVLNRVARLSRENDVCFTASGAHAVVVPGTECRTSEFAAENMAQDGALTSLWQAGVSPLHAVRMSAGLGQYRIGTDLLRRGDFESASLFGTHERAWISSPSINIVPGDEAADSRSMRIDLKPGETVRAGMKVFLRTFTPSTPATLSGRWRVTGDAGVRFELQRRRDGDAMSVALSDGPTTEIGAFAAGPGDWQGFALDHAMPRLATRSVRLLITVENPGTSPSSVWLDDLAWVQWRTPWRHAGVAERVSGEFGTHLQWRAAP